MSDATPAASGTAGERLAAARARLGLSIDQVAEKLKLDPHTVVALEAGDYRVIGATVFVRGFLRRYAELVGESPAEIDALYARRPDAGAIPDLTSTGMHRLEPAEHRRRLGVVPALVTAAVFAVVAAVWWALRVPQVIQAASPERAEVVHVDEASATPGQTPRSLDAAPAAPVSAGEAPAARTPANGGPAAAATSGALPATPPTTAVGAATGDAAGASPPVVTAPKRRLQVSFNGESWLEVYDARGWRLYFGFGHAGSAQTLSGVPPFRLVLGNADAVAVAIEGAPVALPSATPGARLRVSLNGRGAVSGVR